MLYICQFSPSSSSPLLFWNLEQKKYFTDLQTVNTIQLFVALKGMFLVYSFSGKVAAKDNSQETI